MNRLTELGEGDELAASFAGFIDPVDGLLDRKLKVQPSWLGIDGSSLVLANGSDHRFE